jgi:dihydropyrimidinase
VSDRWLIAGGQVVTASSVFTADVLVAGGSILAVGRELDAAGAELIDATGCYVLPGAIDAHTHVAMPAGPVVTVDDYDTATAAAAIGGTTTIIDFVIQRPGQGVTEALTGWRAKLDACPLWVDVGFHFACVDLSVPGRWRSWRCCPTRGSARSSCSWPTRARLWSATARCSR